MKHMKKLISLFLLVITLTSAWHIGDNSNVNSNINPFFFEETEIKIF